MVVVSGEASPAEAFELSSLGIGGFLEKPTSRRALDELLTSLSGPLDRVERVAAHALGVASLDDVQRHVGDALVQAALERTGGNKSAAARLLETTRQSIQQRLHRLSDQDENG